MIDDLDVSVVLSVYNGAPTLAETLDSILRQENVRFELIVIDDGSTDESGAILRDHASRDSRIRVLEQENRGLTRSLIRGCSEARAPLIARHDAGDRSHPERLGLQKAAFDEHPGLSFVSSWTDFFGPEWEYLYTEKGTGQASGRAIPILDLGDPKGVIDGPTSHPSVMLRKEAYEEAGGYRAPFAYSQDWDLWYRLATTGSFLILPRALYDVRVEPAGVSMRNRRAQSRVAEFSLESHRLRQKGKDDAEILAAAERVTRQPPSHSRRRLLAEGNYFIGSTLLRNGDRRCRRYLRRAVELDPLYVRGWIRLAESLFMGEPRATRDA
ncbi:MAG TPA: glycosyltransferase family 2 protein [Thermoanaerobaculia bacterium]|nr:glycosyltransferase family 2 protein [Thermoanaerobaculia bacterium]